MNHLCNGACETVSGCQCVREALQPAPIKCSGRPWRANEPFFNAPTLPLHRAMSDDDMALREAAEDEVEDAVLARQERWLAARILFWIVVCCFGAIGVVRWAAGML
jgi:hypothetical protein